MGGYEVCQHCSNAVHANRAVFKDGYSYHRKCRKCYVCSETDLQDAEVFRGVIFCSSCARRIFRGCATARGTKRPARRRRCSRDMHGVIERARAAPSSSSSFSSLRSKTFTAVPAGEPRVNHDCYCVSDVVTHARKLIKYIFYQTQNLVRHEKVDIAQCSGACKRMLDDLCPLPDPKPQASSTASHPRLTRRPSIPLKISSACNTSRSRSLCKGRERKSKKMKKDANPCSDLRIAELGASIEIATMALRTTSRKKVQSESRVTPEAEEPKTFSTFSETETAATSNTSNEEYVDSECQEYRESKESDGGGCSLARMMKRPFKIFKKNIIERSSLISVIADIETERDCRSAFKCLKSLFQDEAIDHHYDGYKKLYSTINKNKMPFKLGWLEMDEIGDRKTCPCRHYAECHSYRCMREQVMKVAGPTQSKMHVYRNKMKHTFVAPFLKKKTEQVEHSTQSQSSSQLIQSRLQERHRRSM